MEILTTPILAWNKKFLKTIKVRILPWLWNCLFLQLYRMKILYINVALFIILSKLFLAHCIMEILQVATLGQE